MSENGTVVALREAMIAYAMASAYAQQRKTVKGAILERFKSVIDEAAQAGREARAAKAVVTNVHIPSLTEAGAFYDSTRLPVPGVGWVQSVPQPDQIIVSDPVKFLDALSENKMLRDMLVIGVEIVPGVAEQLLQNQPKFPGLKRVAQKAKVSMSIKEWEKTDGK